VQQQQRQQRTALGAGEHDDLAVVVDQLERPENPILHLLLASDSAK
jgi:hypothetical protein